MNVERLVEFHHAAPFKPFRIYLSDGGHVDVYHPDFLARSPTGRTIVVSRLDDTLAVLDLLHVTRLEVLPGRRPKPPRKSRPRR